MSRGGRRAYNRVSNDEHAPGSTVTTDGTADGTIDGTAPVPAPTVYADMESQHRQGSISIPSRINRLTRSSSSSTNEQDALNPDSLQKEEENNNNNNISNNDTDTEERIRVVIMDPAQNKFDVSVHPNWNVARLKKEGVAIHKIATAQQRLIFMGRMLADDTTLQEAKIVKDGVIIHLFPKPRVVLQSRMTSNTNDTHGVSAHMMDLPGGNGGGAHVPQIVLDPDEAQMRSQILVLGSAEILDAQNNVKLLSFLLLIITSMALLSLFTILLGVPQEPDEVAVDDDQSGDAIHHNSGSHAHTHSAAGGGGGAIRLWRHSDYFDLAINLFGFYAAMLGIKATTDNTRRLAFRYLICTVVCGVLWNAFYFYLNFEVGQSIDEEESQRTGKPLTEKSDLFLQSFFAILFPMIIWCICCMRAHQFHSLLEEAEMEAEGRIQNELQMQEEGNADDADADVGQSQAAGGVLT